MVFAEAAAVDYTEVAQIAQRVLNGTDGLPTDAAMAVSELIERLTHYGEEPVPNEVLLRMHDREISTNLQTPRSLHYCDPGSGKLGLGDTTPFLEQTWQA